MSRVRLTQTVEMLKKKKEATTTQLAELLNTKKVYIRRRLERARKLMPIGKKKKPVSGEGGLVNVYTWEGDNQSEV